MRPAIVTVGLDQGGGDMSDRLPKGTKIAGHQIVDVLGQGGFGITYKARNLKLGEPAAIKEYFPHEYAERELDLSVSPRAQYKKVYHMGLDAFFEEANLLRDLPNLPGLVRVRAAFSKHSTAYCIMDYIEGDPLDRMVTRFAQRNTHIPEALVRSVAASLGDALGAVHQVGLIHRDVKPGNIMIRRDGQPILIDFGAARPLGRTVSMGSMFTRKYAAIEQFPREVVPLPRSIQEGPQADIFALSVMLYEMVSTSLPPSADQRFKALKSSGRDIYVPVRENLRRNRVDASYPAALLDMIDEGCALMPDDRPSDARRFTARVAGGQPNSRPRQQPPASPKSAAPQSPAPQRQAKMPSERSRRTTKRRNPKSKIAMLVIIVCLAGLAAAVGFIMRDY